MKIFLYNSHVINNANLHSHIDIHIRRCNLQQYVKDLVLDFFMSKINGGYKEYLHIQENTTYQNLSKGKQFKYFSMQHVSSTIHLRRNLDKRIHSTINRMVIKILFQKMKSLKN